MDATNKSFNIITSLDKYLYDNLVTTQGMTIDWEGGDSVDISKVNEWIQPRIMMGVGNYIGGGASPDQQGQETHLLYNVNIFVKRGSTTQKNRLQAIRDIVASYYTIGKTINLYDYADTDAVVEQMLIRDIETDSVIPPDARSEEESTYYQYNYTPEIVVIQRW